MDADAAENGRAGSAGSGTQQSAALSMVESGGAVLRSY
jgi:hypothetical protein